MAVLSSNSQISAALYSAFWDRAPDADGQQFWVNKLNSGVTPLAAATAFYNSDEGYGTYKASMRPDTDLPVDSPYNVAQYTKLVTQAYAIVFERQPDLGGLNFYVNQMKGGTSFPQVILNMITNALSLDNQDTAQFLNEVNVGVYVSETLDSMKPDVYGPALQDLGPTPQDLATREAELNTLQKTETLTTSMDIKSGNVLLAPQAYTPGGTDLLNTLQNMDQLTGLNVADAAGPFEFANSKLIADLGNPNAVGITGGFEIMPSMTDVRVLDLAFINTNTTPDGVDAYLNGYNSNGITLNAEDTSGTVEVNMTRIAGQNRATVANLDGSEVQTVSVSNSNAQSQALFTFLNSTMGGAASNTLNVNLNNVSLYDANADVYGDAALAISATDPQGSEMQAGFEVFNITVGGTRASTVATFDTGNTDYDDIVPGELPQALNITANQNFDIGTFRWMSNRVESYSASQNGFLEDPNHNVSYKGIGLTRADQIRAITLSGAGDVTLANVGHFDSVLDGDSQIDFTLDASKLTGDLTADITNASASTDTSTSITGGAGDDRFYVAGEDVLTSVSGGSAGNDTLTVQDDGGIYPSFINPTVEINLRAGTGMDTLNLVEAEQGGSSTWNVDLTNGGFNLVTINNEVTAGNEMTVNASDIDVAQTSFSIRSQGLDRLDQPETSGTQGAVVLNLTQATTAVGDTLNLHLGEVSSDQATTDAFSWKNFTNDVTLDNITSATVNSKVVQYPSIDNVDLEINSAGTTPVTNNGVITQVPAEIFLTVFDDDFTDTMTVTTGNGSTNTLTVGAVVAPGYNTNYDAATDDIVNGDAQAIGAVTYDGSAYNGNQNLIFGGTQERQVPVGGQYAGQTVLTGNGNDWVDLSYIETNTSNTVAGYLQSTFLLNTDIDLAGGSNTVVLSADLSDPRAVLAPDWSYDKWFTNWTDVDHLIVNGRNEPSWDGDNATESYVAYDYHAQQAGLQDISFTGTSNNTSTRSLEDTTLENGGRMDVAGIFVGYDYTGNNTAADGDQLLTVNAAVNDAFVVLDRSMVDVTVNLNNPNVDLLIDGTGASLEPGADNEFVVNYNNIDDTGLDVSGADVGVGVNFIDMLSLTLETVDGNIDVVTFNGNTDGDVVFVTGDELTFTDFSTTYDFRGLVNSDLLPTEGDVYFDASDEVDTSGLTIYGSTDGGPITKTVANVSTTYEGVINNHIIGSDGTFEDGYGNDTIVTGGFNDEICAEGGNDVVTYTNTYINATKAVDSTYASSVYAWGDSGNDILSATVTSAAGVVYLDGGIDDDVLTVIGNADATLVGGLGSDKIIDGAGQSEVIGGENADDITLAGAIAASIDNFVVQGLSDSERATNSNFGPGLRITAGDTMTFTDGVDIVRGFKAGDGGDVLVGDIRISRSLMGQQADNLVTSGWLSGTYNEVTGKFTVAANGAGPDTAFIQYTGAGNDNLVVGNGEARNENIIILKGVNSAELVNSNFALGGAEEGAPGFCGDKIVDVVAEQGIDDVNVIPLYNAGHLTLENGSWSPVQLTVSASGAFTPAGAVDPDTPAGFSQTGLTTVDFSNLGGSNTGADPSAGVKISLDGSSGHSTGLTSVKGTSGDDEFVFANQVLGVAGSSGSGGVTIDGLSGINTLSFTAYNGSGAGPLGNGDVGGTLINIDEVHLLGGTSTGSGGLTLANTLTNIEVSNLSTGTAATVNLGSGSGNSYVSSTMSGDVITLGAATQDADFYSTSATLTALSGNDIGLHHATGTTLTLGSLTSFAANFNGGTGTGDTLSFTNASSGTGALTATGGNFFGIEAITLTNAATGTGDSVSLTLNSASSGLKTLNLGYTTSSTVGVTMTDDQADALTAINLTGGTGTGGATLTLAANATVDFSNTVITDSSVSGSGVLGLTLGTGTNEITLSVTQFNNTSGAGFNTITAVTGTGADNTLVITGASGETATGGTGNAPAGIDTIELGGTNAISINDSTNAGVVREYIGNTASNTFTLGGQITAAKTVDLGVDSAQDTVTFDTGIGSSGSTAVTSILNFDAGSGGDIANIGSGVTTVAGIVTDGASVTATAVGSALSTAYVLAGTAYEIQGALTDTGDAGNVEDAIIEAALLVTGAGTSGAWLAGDSFYAILANDEDTGIYRVSLAANAATGGTTLDLPSEFSVTLVGVIDGIGNANAQSYIAANFV